MLTHLKHPNFENMGYRPWGAGVYTLLGLGGQGSWRVVCTQMHGLKVGKPLEQQHPETLNLPTTLLIHL